MILTPYRSGNAGSVSGTSLVMVRRPTEGSLTDAKTLSADKVWLTLDPMLNDDPAQQTTDVPIGPDTERVEGTASVVAQRDIDRPAGRDLKAAVAEPLNKRLMIEPDVVLLVCPQRLRPDGENCRSRGHTTLDHLIEASKLSVGRHRERDVDSATRILCCRHAL